MKLIIGLGNPGAQYHNTRHNLGFMIVDRLLKETSSVDESVWDSSTKLKSEIAIVPDIGGQKVILAKPQTYMNNSGISVSLLAQYYKVSFDDIWIVYDELDLPLGTIKIRYGGAAAGHHGVESVIEQLGTDAFWRFRMGIGVTQPIKQAAAFVLGGFDSSEQGKLRDSIAHGADALTLALTKDLHTAMNRYNAK